MSLHRSFSSAPIISIHFTHQSRQQIPGGVGVARPPHTPHPGPWAQCFCFCQAPGPSLSSELLLGLGPWMWAFPVCTREPTLQHEASQRSEPRLGDSQPLNIPKGQCS